MQSVLRRSHKISTISQRLKGTAAKCTLREHTLRFALRPHNRPHLTQSFKRSVASTATPFSIWTAHLHAGHSNISSDDTIYALSTAPGRAAIAVIRISGPGCLQVSLEHTVSELCLIHYIQVYQSLCRGRPLPRARTATVRKLYDPAYPSSADHILDPAALLLYFPAPNSVTGEDVLELHTHGGPAIVKAVLNAVPLGSSRGGPINQHSTAHTIRHAEPGEFTKRAFYNNRLDLTQIEALGDSLSAETEQQRRLAVNGTENGLGSRYEKWRHLLLYARGELEALIDFSEDQHFDESPADLTSSISKQITRLKREMMLHIQNASKGELLRNGISIALLGAPNAGKSSLLNRIVGREAAIVSSEEGTTRDIVDVSVDIGGWLCRLGDMAGLRRASSAQNSMPSSDAIGVIEKEGMRRAKTRALTSDLVLVMLSLEKSMERGPASLMIDENLFETVHECEKLGKPMIVVINKIDKLKLSLGQGRDENLFLEVNKLFPSVPKEHVFLISCLEASNQSLLNQDPGNIQSLLRGLQSYFAVLTNPSSPSEHTFDRSYWEQSLSVSHRQSEYLRQCLHHLDDFLSQVLSQYHSDDHEDLVSEIDIVAAAEHLRFAANCLAKITGKGEAGDVEDVLGVVFEK
jgi:tRNA modification GTPase